MKKPAIIIGAILFLLVILGYFLAYLPYTRIKAKAQVVMASAKQLKDTIKKNNVDLLNGQLADLDNKYHDFENEAKSIYWATFIPYVSDFKNGVEAGDYLIKAAQSASAAVTPYADLIGFKKGTGSFVEKSAENRLQTAVLTLDKVLTNVDVISNDIYQAQIRLDKIDPSRYPENLAGKPVRPTIVNAKEQFDGLASLFVDAKPLLKRIPELFGKDKEKTYLLLFQNDKELRATGGFLTAYAVATVKDGKIKILHSEDIYTLDNSIASHPAAPFDIATYHLNVNQFNIRDSNLSPDLPTSMGLFNSLYDKSGEKVKYDGVILIDSKVLVDMLTIFGDTEVDGVRFSSQIDKRCNCAQVLYQLFDMVDRPVNYVKTNRKGILGDLMYALFYKAIGFSPSKYWGTLAQQMFTNLQQKHILLYFTDPDLEKSVDKLNFAGTVRQYDGDFLELVNVNFAGAKSNMFVSEAIVSDTKTNDNGKITREVHVTYTNPFPHSDCSLERGGLCLNAILRNWVRLYVPKGATLTDFKGSTKKVRIYDELGKTVFEGFMTVDPQGRSEIDVTYTLPSSVAAGNYRLLVEKQAGTDNQKLTVRVDGRKMFDGILDTDHEIK